MKRVVFLLTFTALAVNLLLGQTPANVHTKASESNPSAQASKEELNLRAYVEFLRMDLNKQKSQIIADVMQFDAGQAASFWPIYRDFQTDLGKIGDQIVELVKDYVTNYDNMTDELADRLATKLLDIERDRNDLKRKYYTNFKTALDSTTAARFLQVENQIEKLIDLQIASQLPVVGGSGK